MKRETVTILSSPNRTEIKEIKDAPRELIFLQMAAQALVYL